MSRKLVTQIKNDWRSNLWLVIELMIVSVAIWYMITDILSNGMVKNLPNGYHTENVYKLQVNTIPEDNPDISYPTDSAALADFRINGKEALLKSVESRPGVQYVAATHNMDMYQYNYSGTQIKLAEAPDSILTGGNVRRGTPEVVDVLQFEPLAGAASREELRKVLERGELIITRSCGRALLDRKDNEGRSNPFADGLEGAKKLLGQKVVVWDKTFIVGAVAEDMRRGRIEPAFNGNIVMPVPHLTGRAASLPHILVRVEPSKAKAFEEDFKSNPKAYRAGPFYVSECIELNSQRDSQELYVTIADRNSMIVMIFLLSTIFLGLLGTFWFRTGQRKSEIAVRKSVGATSADIFRRLIGEGLLLLAIASVLAFGADFAIARWGTDQWESVNCLFAGGSIIHLLKGFGITFVCMTIMTIAGIWIPAAKAMAIEPATALHAE